MKVAVHYSDGQYSLYDPTKRTFAAGTDPDTWMQKYTIDIPESEWRLYQWFLALERRWHQKIQAYDDLIGERNRRAT